MVIVDLVGCMEWRLDGVVAKNKIRIEKIPTGGKPETRFYLAEE